MSALVENGAGTGWTVKGKLSKIISLFVELINLINTTRCGKVLYSEMNTHSTKPNDVKMSSTWGKSAWVIKVKAAAGIPAASAGKPALLLVQVYLLLADVVLDIQSLLVGIKNKPGCYNLLMKNSSFNKKELQLDSPSETTRSAFYSGTIKNSTKFYEWLVGVTDGDGTFHFSKTKKGIWSFTFKIGQSNYNLRLLYYIKSNLGVGSVSVPNSKDNTAEFRIRNIQHIIEYVLPIFDKYPLLTSKYFNYSLFKKAILIMNDQSISKEEKDKLISELKSKSLVGIPNNYISPAWQVTGNTVTSITDAQKVMTKSWLIGFTEAEGSFYIVKKGPHRLVHAFEITQKLDIIVLEAIAHILGLKVTHKKLYKTVVTTKSDAIQFLVNYYHKTMKGMKALEYRI
jgi:hypothetical protein